LLFHFIMQVPTESLFFGSCLNICAHFDILRESYDGDKKKFVEKHQQLLDLVETLNKLYGPIIFVQFLANSILLCVLGFQLVMSQSVLKKAVAVSFGSAAFIQLFVYTYGGQLVMDKSSCVAEELYQTDKDLIILICRAQKASVIKFGFYQANSKTLTSILSATASLITLLKSFLD
jgi:7tm Odorant receptor